ncbi:MAG: hypothetical protein ACREKL_07505 [Chthoniobacterales bacterium]
MKKIIFRGALAALVCAVLPLHAQITWPRQLPSSVGEITVYQPQIDTYTGNQFTAHAAVSIAQAGGKPPVFGAVFFTATVATDLGTDTVNIENITVTNSRFPSATAGTADAVSQAIAQAATQDNLTLSQTQLLSQLALTQKEQAAAQNLNNTPPQILFETQPTVLVVIDGEPKLTQAPNSSLMTVVNTPFFIALDPETKTYYLRGGGQWLSTTNILQGPWTVADAVPGPVAKLSTAQQLAQPTSAQPEPAGVPPQVIVTTQPTELIQTTGPAEYGPIENTNLLYVTNTDSDVFMDINTQSLYVLLSGRWFSAATQSGPWTYVQSSQLPADFSSIPPGLPISNVLASIPNTDAAKNAVLDAQIPQTAKIERTAEGPKVIYAGDPKFEPVAKSSPVSYAVNTKDNVVQVADTYYVCSDAVWYQSAAALGPWVVSTQIPQSIYAIPPTCPAYPVTYCNIYSVTPDVVYCGYLPGYTGSYVYGGTVVYGTGWPYNGWYGDAFFPRPVTWGFGATFSTGWGCWGFGVGAGWGAASFGCGYNSGWWGAGNYHWNNWNWNNNWNQNVNVNRNVTNNYNTNINRTVNNLYRNHPNRLTPGERTRLQNNENHLANQETHLQNQIDRDRSNPDSIAAQEQRRRDREQENRDDAQQKIDRQELQNREHPNRDDVYADRDGNVYRHDPNEGWQRRENNEWHRPSGDDYNRNRGDLNRQFGARAHGEVHRSAPRGGGGRRR